MERTWPLSCPACAGDLALSGIKADGPIECRSCNRAYSIGQISRLSGRLARVASVARDCIAEGLRSVSVGGYGPAGR